MELILQMVCVCVFVCERRIDLSLLCGSDSTLELYYIISVCVCLYTNLSGQLIHPRSLHTLKTLLLLPLRREEEGKKDKFK